MNATIPFGADYARAYDALYADKDYASECDLIESILAIESQSTVRSILDLGCGTGRHASVLAERGYDVLGVDRSPHMIERARTSTKSITTRLDYAVADLCNFRSDRRFDAALMMFAVLGYQLEDAEVIAALQTARTHLVEGGLLLFDCWYGPAVLHQQPSDRSKIVETDSGRLRRQARSRIEPSRRRVIIDFDVERIHNRTTMNSKETHAVRYFFPEDISKFVRTCGFSLVRIGAMPEFDRDPDESTWNVLTCARAVGDPTAKMT